MPRHDVQAKHILITGASTGLGRAMALEFARRGARVGLIARREEHLKSLQAEIEEAGGRAAFFATDVVNAAALREGVLALEEALGPVYGLIANAGIAGNTRGGLLSLEHAHRCIDVNVKGVLNSVAATQEGMIGRNEGFVSVVSSLAAYRGLPTSGPYSASKAAVSTLLESLRVDHYRSNLTFTVIHPGFVKTPLTDAVSHPTPFMITAEKAARIMANGLIRGKREVNYPFRLAFLMTVVRRFPNFLYDWVLSRTVP